MAYSVNWVTGLILIPLSDLVLAYGKTYELALSDFHTEIRRLESDFGNGLWARQILDHTSPKIISGVTYAAFDEIDPFYSIEFTGSPDAVILKGSNNNILDVYAFNGVSVAPNNSTGLQDLSTLLASAYNAEVCFSLSIGLSGTSVPIGTRSRPSSSWIDTYSILTKFGINTVRCLESVDLDIDAQFSGQTFIADNPLRHTIVIQPDAGADGCIFDNATVTGTLDGDNVLKNSYVYDLVAISGIVFNCVMAGTTEVESGALLTMVACDSGVAGGGPTQIAIVDLNGDGSLRNSGYTGGILLRNFTGGGDISMDVQGRVIVDPSCTGGVIYVRGDCIVTDNSTGSCIVIDDTNNKKINEMWNVLGLDPLSDITIGNGVYNSTLLDVAVIDNNDGTYTLSRQ